MAESASPLTGAWDDNEPSMTWNGTRTSSATPTPITWPAWRDGADLIEMNVMTRRADGLQFEGEFYELLVWDRTLSEEEVFEVPAKKVVRHKGCSTHARR